MGRERIPDVEVLTAAKVMTWTTAGLVLHIAKFAAAPISHQRNTVALESAKIAAAELNLRVPSRTP